MNDKTRSSTRKPRPSRARGIRSATGCVTCRQRRVKCDEKRPVCGGCSKAEDRQCKYATDNRRSTVGRGPNTTLPQSPAQNFHENSCASPSGHQLSLILPRDEVSPNSTSQLYAGTPERPSPRNDPGDGTLRPIFPELTGTVAGQPGLAPPSVHSPLQSFHPIAESTSLGDALLGPAQSPNLIFGSLDSVASSTPGNAAFEWYDLVAQDAINNVAKNAIAASDPRWNFDEWLPSRRGSQDRGQPTQDGNVTVSRQPDADNDGFAVAPWANPGDIEFEDHEVEYFTYYVQVIGPMLDFFDRSRQFTEVAPHLARRNFGLAKSLLAVSARYRSLLAETEDRRDQDRRFATQFFYQTLNYLAQAIQNSQYTRSPEILATAIMISTYEMFDGSNREWERHLKGAFWIQRYQNNDGESGGLRQAVWWAWLRQDIWAAFRDGRKTLTMWVPKRPLASLSADELALRILYIAAKVVEYASVKAAQTQSWQLRMEQGDQLQQDLNDWYAILPETYKPLPGHRCCINPPAYAGALQYYNFAQLLLSLHRPFLGGVIEHRARQVSINQIVNNVIEIVVSQSQSNAAAFVNFQTLYVAGLCTVGSQQDVLVDLLSKTLDITGFPNKSLIDDLWKSG